MLQPFKGSNEKAEEGSRGHLSFARGDLSLCNGDPYLEREVSAALEFFAPFAQAFPVEHHEIRLDLAGLNFGTLDILRFSRDGTRALIGDLKFGWWPVTPAAKNLQLRNYAVLVFHAYPQVRSVRCVLYHTKHRTSTSRLYTRRHLPKMLVQIRRIIDGVQQALRNPQPSDYHPAARNCGFCARLNCPARAELTSQILTYWTGSPVPVLNVDLQHVDSRALAALKRINNALKACSRAIDAEAHRRMIDNGEELPGYEVKEQSSPRQIIGTENLNKSLRVLEPCFDGLLTDRWSLLRDQLLAHVEISWADVERAIKEVVPPGRFAYYQQLALAKLTEAKLIDSHLVYAVRAVRE
jgi:hypothetical protein